MGEDIKRKLFVNRELSWLEFNRRVLFEAFDNENPLFERLKFISIYFSNLDEFFMVRVGSLMDQKTVQPDKLDDKTGWNIDKQLEEIYSKVESLSPLTEKAYSQTTLELKNENVDIIDFNNISKIEAIISEKYFNKEIQPVLSPQIIDKKHPFPFLKNKEIYILAVLKNKRDNYKIGIIPINIPDSYFTFNADGRKKIVFIADIVKHFAYKLFYKYTIKEVYKIRVTRNADITVDETILDSDNDMDFRGIMQDMLKKRKSLAPVRIQISEEPSKKVKKYICNKLDCDERLISVQNIPMDFSFGFNLYKKLKLDDRRLLFKENKPVKNLNIEKGNWIKYIEENDILLNFPFQSIQYFVELLYEAADDPSVLSIKISLYRLASHSKIISALAYAAERGKKILCVLELRARFDEQNNIDYSKLLEDAGCTVIYGLRDYKVHAKVCLITKKHLNHTSYITQIGTGNYNEKTSEQYTDLSFITSDYNIGADADNMFMALYMGEVVENTHSLWIAPRCYKENVLKMIDEEIKRQRNFGDGFIAIKINSINDIDIMEKFSEASRAGVVIELYVRGICCIRPGIQGYTGNIKIKSIVGKYLEHSRIFCFGRNGRERLFIGSGDLLNRNTRRRVEVFVPVKSADEKEHLLKILELCRMDNNKGWVMQSDATYKKEHVSKDAVNSQLFFEKYFSEMPKKLYKEQNIFDIMIEKFNGFLEAILKPNKH